MDTRKGNTRKLARLRQVRDMTFQAAQQLDELHVKLVAPLRELTELYGISEFRQGYRKTNVDDITLGLSDTVFVWSSLINRSVGLQLYFQYKESTEGSPADRYLEVIIHESDSVGEIVTKAAIFKKKIDLKPGLPITELYEPVLSYLKDTLLVYMTM